MVVILNFRVPSRASELGRTIEAHAGAVIELEPMVPGEEVSVPFFWIHARDHDVVVDSLREQPTIRNVELVGTVDDAALIALEWDSKADDIFRGISRYGAYLLRGVCREGN